MIEWDDDSWRRIRETAGDDWPKILPSIKRCMRILSPPYPEPETVACGEARQKREANRLLRECLAKPKS